MIQMNVLEYPDPAEWDAVLANLPGAHILQSVQWADQKKANGWLPIYLTWTDSYANVVAATVLHRKSIPVLGRLFGTCLLYAPRGPLLARQDLDLASQVISGLEIFAGKARAIFIKIDPEIPIGWDLDETADPFGRRFADELSRRGWRYSQDQIQFRNTILLDLRPDETDLLNRMKQKTRYNIRLAERKGVTVRKGQSADLPVLYQMYVETAYRVGFVIRTRDYYLDVWQSLMDSGMATPLIAEAAGEAVAGMVLFHYAGRAYYFYGMSTDKYRDWMPNHLLQWRAMQYAKSLGCSTYDFWGAPDQFDPSDSMHGVYRFKEGFNGRILRGLGAWDYTSSTGLYSLYTKIMPFLLEILRSGGRRRIKTEVR
jgi:lipid II:glycine glycyltransferase (peptidoglycan interpeptide bridge formation enzyme)